MRTWVLRNATAALLLAVLIPNAVKAAGTMSPGTGEVKGEVVVRHHFLPGNRLLTIGGQEGEIFTGCCGGAFCGSHVSMWNVYTGQRTNEANFTDDFEETAASEDGKYLASWLTDECDHPADGIVRIYRIEPGDGSLLKPEKIVKGPKVRTSAVAFSPSNEYIVVANERPKDDQSLRIFERSTGKQVAYFTTKHTVTRLVFSPDGKWLAARAGWYESSEIVVWDFMNRRKVGKLAMPKSVANFKFSADSTKLVLLDETTAFAYTVGSKLSDKEDFNMRAAQELFSPGYTTEVKLASDRWTGTDVITFLANDRRTELLTISRTPRPAVSKPLLDPLRDELVRSADGKFAVVASTIVDIDRRQIRPLQHPVSNTFAPWIISTRPADYRVLFAPNSIP